MAYKEKFKNDLIKINKLIDEKTFDGEEGALAMFQKHIVEVSEIGKFTIDSWNHIWRNKVYDFGTKFKDVNPIDFLNILTTEKANLVKDKQEVLDFYYSEIEANSLSGEICEKRIEALVEKYPYNPEFRHTFGHFYKRKKEFEKANEQYRFALNKDKKFRSFIESIFASYYQYLETLIDKSEYEEGLKICEEIIKEDIFENDDVYYNYIFSFKERFKDYSLLNKKILDAELKIKEIVSKETNSGQLKIIEILGFFTAIIAFVFSTLSVGKNFDFKEAIIFNITLGITLLNFALLISLLFSREKVNFKDFRIVLLIILTLILSTIIASIYWL